MDPLTLRDVLTELGPVLAERGIDASSGIALVNAELERLNDQVTAIPAGIPPANRKLVTGHESLGYFAQRYNFQLVGAIIPSLAPQAGVSAKELARLVATVREQQVWAVFTEIGTPKRVAASVGSQTGVKVVELATINLPDDGSYSTFLSEDAIRIAAALSAEPGVP